MKKIPKDNKAIDLINLLVHDKSNEEIYELLGNYVTVFDKERYIKFGFSKEFVQDCEETYKSDTSDYKSTIFDDVTGEVIESLTGVMNPVVVIVIGSILGIDTRKGCNFFGRGKQHWCKLDNLMKALDEYGSVNWADHQEK
tara:strand:+ start:158 stop:580 length:423 start_codon:yes stop_codon:yes gene_type:complete